MTGLADDVSAAKLKTYQSLKQVGWEDIYFRTDIGDQASSN